MRNGLLAVLLLVMLLACERAAVLYKFSGQAQGTTYSVTYWSQTPVERQQFEQAIATELQRLDKLMSNYRPDSVIEHFNQSETLEPLQVGEEITQLVLTAQRISQATAGCYDPTVRPLFSLWGFRAQQLYIPTQDELNAIAPQLGINTVIVSDALTLQKPHPKLSIDLSSIAQGYSVHRLTVIAEQFGIENYLIEIGGELQTRGKKPDGSDWRIAIERPLPGAQQLQKIVQIQQQEPLAIMTSGTYRHFYDHDGTRYSHILDGRNLRPVTHSTVSVTVLHDDLTEADAWSTALLCLGSAEGLEVAEAYSLAVLFIDQQDKQFTELKTSHLREHKGIKLIDVK